MRQRLKQGGWDMRAEAVSQTGLSSVPPGTQPLKPLGLGCQLRVRYAEVSGGEPLLELEAETLA